jgi:hypothetical protein
MIIAQYVHARVREDNVEIRINTTDMNLVINGVAVNMPLHENASLIHALKEAVEPL